MKTLHVEATQPYDVHIGNGVFATLGTVYGGLLEKSDKIVIIADERVAALHLERLLQALDGHAVLTKAIPSGEQAKSAEVFMDCHSFLLEQGCSRKSLILAFGGGATGDVAGFVASTFMRGIPFIQVPTTILAHDSAVGGKTAINHPLGKNMIGTFYQPAAVLFETALLSSLPKQEVRSGMAEVIKHAFLSNARWLDELLAVRDFSQLDEGRMAEHLEKGILVKAAIVSEDERESGVRQFLNFGHTLAHALEGHIGYGNITHGEAVVLGMCYALQLSGHAEYSRFLEWAYAHGYPLERIMDTAFADLLPYMKKDKKSSAGRLNFVLLEETGKPSVQTVAESEAESAYMEMSKDIKEMIA